MTTTYPASLSTLTGRVRTRLQTSSTATDHWTAALIKDALNRYQRIVQNELLLAFENYYFTDSQDSITPVNNTIRFSVLDRKFKRLVGFYRQIGESATSGIPGEYVLITIVNPSRYQEFQAPLFPRLTGRTYGVEEVWTVYPEGLRALGSAAVSGVYKIDYQYQVADLQDDDDVTEIPEEYQDLLVDGATAHCLRNSGEEPQASQMKMEFEAGLGEMRRTGKQIALTQQYRVRNTYAWRRGRR